MNVVFFFVLFFCVFCEIKVRVLILFYGFLFLFFLNVFYIVVEIKFRFVVEEFVLDCVRVKK